jgi:hypothetical protein
MSVMEPGPGAAVAHVVGDVVLQLPRAIFILVPPAARAVAGHLLEEQKADEV